MQNALAAVALLDFLRIDRRRILQGLKSFHGVRRRLEFKGESGGIAVYDDFAHHPTAVKASISAIKETHPGGKIWALFQPRSNTSVTNIFQEEWSEAFRQADTIVIAELHRKEKIPLQRRLNREQLKIQLEARNKEVFLWNDAEEILANIINRLKQDDIVLVMSNSDFGGLAGKILNALQY